MVSRVIVAEYVCILHEECTISIDFRMGGFFLMFSALSYSAVSAEISLKTFLSVKFLVLL